MSKNLKFLRNSLRQNVQITVIFFAWAAIETDREDGLFWASVSREGISIQQQFAQVFKLKHKLKQKYLSLVFYVVVA